MIRKRTGRMTIAAAATVALTATWSAAGVVSFDTVGGTYSQNFDTLPNDANATRSNLGTAVFAVPSQAATPTNAQFTSGTYTTLQGWYFVESTEVGFSTSDGSLGGDNSRSVFNVGNGTSTERALGMGGPAAREPFIGVILRNDTGTELTEFTLTYRGEQWRQNSNASALRFSYLLTNSSSTANISAAGTAVAALDFADLDSGPIRTGTAGALDGNAAANQKQSISQTVSIAPWVTGEYLWLRWQLDSPNASSILAIDDLTFTAIPEPGALSLVVIGSLLLLSRRRHEAAV